MDKYKYHFKVNRINLSKSEKVDSFLHRLYRPKKKNCFKDRWFNFPRYNS